MFKCLKLRRQEEHDCEDHSQGERGNRSATEGKVDDGAGGDDDDDDGDDDDDDEGDGDVGIKQRM